MSSDIGIADVIRAWRALDATTDDERRAIARILGFDLIGTETTASVAPERSRSPERGRRDEVVPEHIEVQPESAPTEPVALDLVPFTSVQVNSIDLGTERLALPTPTLAMPPESLFDPRWSRAIASTLTARPASVGEIVIDRVIEVLATRAPLHRVPRRCRLVSTAEVAVVVDERGTLAWFRADVDELVAKIDALTRASVTRGSSDGAPPLGAPGSDRERAQLDLDEDLAKRPPDSIRVGAQGRVIAFTDLGIGSTWQRGDRLRAIGWQRLAVALRSRRASLVIVTPVPLARIDRALSRLASCVFWDRSTRPGSIRRLLKERP